MSPWIISKKCPWCEHRIPFWKIRKDSKLYVGVTECENCGHLSKLSREWRAFFLLFGVGIPSIFYLRDHKEIINNSAVYQIFEKYHLNNEYFFILFILLPSLYLIYHWLASLVKVSPDE